MPPAPPVAAVRSAVRRALADLPAGSLVLVALSGGPDSTALAAAAAHVAPRLGLRAGAVTVDHGLQPGSAGRAAAAAALATDLGLDPVDVVAVEVAGDGGPEAAARAARYAALDARAGERRATVVLLGHTLDDQAETVLLRLARGSGARALAGMPAVRGRYRRPLLGLRRADTRAACAAAGLTVWDDPHNHDPALRRARVRHDVLPALTDALGAGVARSLVRTATQLREDTEALDGWAAEVAGRLGRGRPDGLVARELAGLPKAVRTRVLRRALLDAGVPAGALGTRHLGAVDALVSDWHGQGPVGLPGGYAAARSRGRIRVGGPTGRPAAGGAPHADPGEHGGDAGDGGSGRG